MASDTLAALEDTWGAGWLHSVHSVHSTVHCDSVTTLHYALSVSALSSWVDALLLVRCTTERFPSSIVTSQRLLLVYLQRIDRIF